MNQKKIIIGGGVVLVVLALFMFFDFIKGGLGSQSVSPNILYITQPVNTLSGKVEKIKGNTIFISNQYALPQTATVMVKVVPGQPLVMPTPQTKMISYKIRVGEKTQINQSQNPIPYLIKQTSPSSLSQEKITIEQVKVGQMITVNSALDLRTLKNNEFEATTINLPQKLNTLNGKVVRVTNNTLTLKAFAPINGGPPMGIVNIEPSAPEEKEFTIIVTPDTEISRLSYSAPSSPEESPTSRKPEKLILTDLKKDMQITVFTAEDVTESQTLTALRIEPAQVTPSITPEVLESDTQISPTPSASTSP